jgi:aminopeptidase N
LSGFFKQWLYTPGHPQLTGTWSYDDKAKEVVIGLRQEGPGAPFSFPLEIGLYNAAGKLLKKETVQMNGKEKTFRLKTNEAAANITPDPDVKLLAEVNLRRK